MSQERLKTYRIKSRNNNDLIVPSRAGLQFGERAFSFVALRLRNSLPVDTRNAAALGLHNSKRS